jgi:hypothetical protein
MPSKGRGGVHGRGDGEKAGQAEQVEDKDHIPVKRKNRGVAGDGQEEQRRGGSTQGDHRSQLEYEGRAGAVYRTLFK